jgi:hypothetical protein
MKEPSSIRGTGGTIQIMKPKTVQIYFLILSLHISKFQWLLITGILLKMNKVICSQQLQVILAVVTFL